MSTFTSGRRGLSAPSFSVLGPRRADTLAAVLSSGFFIVAVMQMTVPVTAPLLRADLGLSASQVGLLMSSFLLTYGLSQALSGGFSARFGGRMMLMGLVIMSLGMAAFVAELPYPVLLAARVLQGIGAGFMLPTAGYLMSHHLAPGRLSRGWSIYGAGAALGNLCVLLGLSQISRAAGSDAVYLASVLLAALSLVAGMFLREVRERPPQLHDAPGPLSVLRDLGALARVPGVRVLAVLNIAAISISVGTLTWTPSYLHDSHGASLALAASLTAGYAAAQLSATPLVAVLAPRVGNLRFLYGTFSAMVAAGVFLAFAPNLGTAFVGVLFVGFFTMGSFAPAFAQIPMVVEKRLVGVASGLLNGVGFLGALVSPWLFGLLLDLGLGYRAGYLMLAAIASAGMWAVWRLTRLERP